MNVADVLVVLRKELRETLRDRRTLMVMVLFPLVVYPVVTLLMAEVMAGKQAAEDARMSRVAVTAVGGGVDMGALGTLRAQLTATPQGLTASPPTERGETPQPQPQAPPPPSSSSSSAKGSPASAAVAPPGPQIELIDGQQSAVALRADVAANRLDALVEVGPPPHPGASSPVRIFYDETRAASEAAQVRVASALARALPPGCAHSYILSAVNIAPKSKVGGYVLSKVLPLIVILMTMLGAFYPAIDITAGERERGTLETLLSSPVRRFDLMTGKVLAVAALAALAGLLNIVSMSLTVAEGARLTGATQVLTVPWTRAAMTLFTVLPAAFLFGAVMVAIGAMARGFKEAQTLLTPVYLLCFTPAVIASAADFRLEGPALFIPGTNLTLLARDLMLAHATFMQVTVVLGSTLFYGAVALWFAARLYDSERLLATADWQSIGLGAWLRHLVGRDGRPSDGAARTAPTSREAPTAGHAAALFAVAFVLWFFVFTSLQRWSLIPGLLLSQWLGFFGLVWVYARIIRRPITTVLGLRWPSGWALGGALLLGLSGWVILGVLADRVMPPPPQLIEEMRKLIRPPGGDRGLALSLLALAVTPAICEEALFRGPILRGLRHGFAAPAACLLCGVLFGVLHGDIWRFVPTSLLGGLLSWVALTTGSIVPSMLVHLINNSALIVLGYYGLDQAAEKLPLRIEIAMFFGAAFLFSAGILAIRRGRGQPVQSDGGPASQPTLGS